MKFTAISLVGAESLAGAWRKGEGRGRRVTCGGTWRYIGRQGSLYGPQAQRGAAQPRFSRHGRCRKWQVCAAPSGGGQAVTNNTLI